MKTLKKIIHVDMDAFFASIEQRDFPEYKGKPIAVGGSSERGVVAAASYEARKYGVHSAMPSKTAYLKCPGIIFVKPRFDVYKQVSAQVMGVFNDYTHLVEPLSLDEAYLDVTYCLKNIPTATLIAREIKNRIYETTGLTASAGVSFNKFLAKTASGINKPDGLTVVTPDLADKLIDQLRIEKFHGIGKVTAARLKSMGVHTGKELKELGLPELTRLFGKSGRYFYQVARLEDNREVQPDRETKSVGAENTFEHDLTDYGEMCLELEQIAESVQKRLQRKQLCGRTITIKIKHGDFTQKTRSQTLGKFVSTSQEILPVAKTLLESGNYSEKPVRLLGISISNFFGEKDSNGQLCFDF